MGQTIGHGSQLEINTTGATYVAVNGVVSIDLGSNKVDVLDNTDMGTAGFQRTFVGGLENSGDISAKLNVIPADATQASLSAMKDGTVHNFKAIYPGGVRTISFSGIITSIDEQVPDDKLPTFTVKIQISGPKTIS